MAVRVDGQCSGGDGCNAERVVAMLDVNPVFVEKVRLPDESWGEPHTRLTANGEGSIVVGEDVEFE